MVYDVIIVGAGPAGGMAARVLSANDYDVLAIDKRREIGVPINCGEGISRFALENNNLKPDNSWIKLKVNGAKAICPNGNYFYASGLGYSIDRAKFDQWITYKAVDWGCELILKIKVIGIEKKNELWTVRTTNGEYKGRILIGADGFASNVARWSGLLKSRKYVKGLQYKFDARDIEYTEKEWLCLYYGEEFQRGYGWVFPRGDEYNVGVGGFGPVKQLLPWFCKKLGFDIAKAKSIGGGCAPNHYKFSALTKDGTMIIGDAAGMTNPILGGGIHAALFSGRVAGEVACKVLESKDITLLQEYEKRIKKEPFKDPKMYEAGEIFLNWKNELFNFVGDMLSGKDQQELTIFKGFLEVLKKPKFFIHSRQFLLIRKMMGLSVKYGW